MADLYHQIKTVGDYMFDLHDRIVHSYQISVYQGNNLKTGKQVTVKAIKCSRNQSQAKAKLLNH